MLVRLTRASRSILCLALLDLASGAQAEGDFRPAYDAAQAELSGLLYELEGNLTDKEAIEMNFTDLGYKIDAFTPQFDQLNQRYDELNAYCQGEFEEPEYSRRVAYCDGTASQLDTLKAQLEPEQQNLKEQFDILQQRDTARQADGTEIMGRFEDAMLHLVNACIDMPLDQAPELCHLPSAPGPRTAGIVSEMNATLNAH